MTDLERELMEIQLELIRIDLLITQALERPTYEARRAAVPPPNCPRREASAPASVRNADQGE